MSKEQTQEEIKATVLDVLQAPETVIVAVEFNNLDALDDDDTEVVVRMKARL